MKLTRRDFLKGTLLIGGSAFLPSLLPSTLSWPWPDDTRYCSNFGPGWEVRLRIGTDRLSSLETSSELYLKYGTPIGLKGGKGIDLGELTHFWIDNYPKTLETYEIYDLGNGYGRKYGVQPFNHSEEYIDEEDIQFNMEIQQWDARVIEVLLGTGVMFDKPWEGLAPTGGPIPKTHPRPLEISAIHHHHRDDHSYFNGLVWTLYDCRITSKIPWSDIASGELSVLSFEGIARSVPEYDDKAMSIYVF